MTTQTEYEVSRILTAAVIVVMWSFVGLVAATITVNIAYILAACVVGMWRAGRYLAHTKIESSPTLFPRVETAPSTVSGLTNIKVWRLNEDGEPAQERPDYQQVPCNLGFWLIFRYTDGTWSARFAPFPDDPL